MDILPLLLIVGEFRTTHPNYSITHSARVVSRAVSVREYLTVFNDDKLQGGGDVFGRQTEIRPTPSTLWDRTEEFRVEVPAGEPLGRVGKGKRGGPPPPRDGNDGE